MIALIATVPQDYRDLIGAEKWQVYAIPPGGLEPEPVLQMLVTWAQRLQDAQGWGTWLAIAGGEVVGSLAVKSPPVEGTVEIGYGCAPARRGRGHATAAVQALLPVLASHGVVRVRAQTALANPASARVLEKAGFAQTGTRHDAEDGELQLWERLVP